MLNSNINSSKTWHDWWLACLLHKNLFYEALQLSHHRQSYNSQKNQENRALELKQKYVTNNWAKKLPCHLLKNTLSLFPHCTLNKNKEEKLEPQRHSGVKQGYPWMLDSWHTYGMPDLSLQFLKIKEKKKNSVNSQIFFYEQWASEV